MGFSFSSLAVKGGTRETVLAVLGLRGTGAYEQIPESDLTAASLPSGWYLVVHNNGGPAVVGDVTLERLSADAEVVTCFVEEHIMSSAASMWVDGRRVWSVSHDADQGIEHLETRGSLPSIFAPITEKLHSRQHGQNAGADYIFDIPVEMVHQLTGYRHDRVIPELGQRPFEVLATTDATSKRSWVRR